MKNTREKWLFPGSAEKFVMLFSFAICALILSRVLSNVLKHSVFVDITSPILQLPSLSFFTPTKDAVTIYIKQYPILNIMAFKGVFTGILLAVSYFGFVVVSMRNAKRIKSGYLRTVYQTICLFFLFTGILNILSGFVDYVSQVKLSKVIIAEDILFPFLSPNPVYLISSFFFAGILFGIFYNRVRE
jgi:hypothetical protein